MSVEIDAACIRRLTGEIEIGAGLAFDRLSSAIATPDAHTGTPMKKRPPRPQNAGAVHNL